MTGLWKAKRDRERGCGSLKSWKMISARALVIQEEIGSAACQVPRESRQITLALGTDETLTRILGSFLTLV